MRRDLVLSRLRADEPRLRGEFAVASLALFGSTARDEADEGSDVDLLVEYGRRVGLFHHVATALHLEALLGVPKVDLVFRDAVIDDLRPIIEGEAIDVFGPRKRKFRIRHMLEAIARCEEFAEGLDEPGLAADVLRLHAICWELMTIGEAARHVPPEVEAGYPGIPWAIMRGMRNRVVHGYDRIKVEVVWEVVTADLPPLVPVLERLLHEAAEA